MRSFFVKAVCFCVFFILKCDFTFAQFIDFTSENPYKKVFVETDNFGSSYLNLLEDAYPKAKNDSIKFAILNDLAYYTHTQNLLKAMDFTRRGLKLTREKGDKIWEGRFQITQGAIFLRMEKLDSATIVLESAKTKVLPSDLPLLTTQLGYVFERRGQIDKAADYALETLNLGRELNDKWALAIAYSDLSNLFWKQSKLDTALEYGLESLKIFEERGMNDLDYGFTLFVVGNVYLSLNDYENASHYFRHSIVLGERYGFYNNLSDVYILMVDLHLGLNEIDQAEAAGANALKYAKLLNNDFMTMRSWLAIGKVQNLQGKQELAIESLTKCILVATEDFGDTFYLSLAYEALGNAYAANQQYEKAYLAFTEYDKYRGLVFTVESDQRTALIRNEFDLEDKEEIIQKQESKIIQQRTRQNLTVIIAVLLLLLSLLSYKAMRNKFKTNLLLKQQNDEKEFLLKEIHHRVKNNLEIVSSLLSLQSAQINDRNILNVIEASQHRVQCMSMIHQKLYRAENLAAIEMKEYFLNLSEYIVDAFGLSNQVKVKLIMEKIELDIDLAIPIGLIVNELITNSLKYAFPNKKEGLINISLSARGDKLHLEVVDDGIGMNTLSEVRGTGFGSQLIKLLTEQLDGKMELSTKKGTTVSIQFQLNKAA